MQTCCWILIIFNTVSSYSITERQTIDCDLGLVEFGEDIDCPIDVTYGYIKDDTSLTVTNIFNIIDSTNYTNSFCTNPRISYIYIAIDNDAEVEYINLYEGSTNSHKIKTCDSGFDQGDCVNYQTCTINQPLMNEYIYSSSIIVTVDVPDEVDDLCDDGNKVISKLTLTCQRAEKMVCDTNDNCNDVEFDVDDDMPFYLYCIDDNACSNVTVNAHNSTEIHTKCIGNSSCVNMNILATYSSNINIEADGYNALTDSTIYAEQSMSVTINAEGESAFSNSSIYAQHSQQLDITCFSIFFDGHTCSYSNIYLSSYERANTLICRFGCDKINLFFEHEIDTSIFNEITFKECSLCDTIDECFDEWILHYNNYMYSIIYSPDINNENNTLSNFSDYLYDRYSCTTNETLQNNTVSTFSLTVCIFSLSCLSILLIMVMRSYILQIYSTHQQKYRSNRPSLWILLYSIYADFIIFIALFWCGIKIIMFYTVTDDYCSSKYEYDEDKEYCMDDEFCEYEDSQCIADEPIYGMMIAWPLIFGLWFVYELFFNVCCMITEDLAVPTEFNGAWWPTCDGLRCRMYYKLRNDQEIFNKIYGKRRFWIIPKNCHKTTPGFCDYFLLQLARYGPLTILASIMYAFDYHSDYTVKSYELYPILLLLGSKILLQIRYTFGDKYRPNRETEYILKDIFGQHIAFIIKQFTPLFYQKGACSSDAIIIKEIELMGLIGDRSFTQTEYEQFSFGTGYE